MLNAAHRAHLRGEGIQDELDACNPLITDGHSWKATAMIEYPDEGGRRLWFAGHIGIERRIWGGVDDFPSVL